MKKKLVSMLLVSALAASALTGCGGSGQDNQTQSTDSSGVTGETAGDAGSSESTGGSGEVKEFTAFFATPGTEINDDNEIQQMIAEKTGAKCKETWLTGQSDSEAVGTLIASGEYPDFIEGGSGTLQLYEAGALVALDDYLDNYPNIKALFTEQQWDQLRQDDGKIYWIPQFSCIKNKESVCTHNDEAFWIQTRVLKWADYPEVKTMDQYFDLIEAYNEANPTMEDGTTNIPYTILCDDWRYFCLENAPQFLDGYPNDGSVIVDPETLKIVDYNTTPTAKRYFQKLNEEYKKGIVDPESFTQTYDEYIAKLSTGRVLGMIDQWWDFAYTAGDSIRQQGLDAQGCNYVPLPITIEEGLTNQWHNSGGVLNVSSGLAITVSCDDVEGALKFVDDLLSQDLHNLRFWGVEGVDYNVLDNGEFSRTPEQVTQSADAAYKASHLCTYSYFPQYSGMSDDGINANKPEGQPNEFYANLQADVKECFDAYGVQTYVEMIGTSEAPGAWYPMWSYSNTLTTSTPGGTAWNRMGEIKHEYLPKVVMASDFESGWSEYMDAYSSCNPQDFLDEMQAELDKRMEEAAKYN
ncbi:MAG: sugar ABC transporter substrate-binding protein [Lachnospiraceae bacterium]|nr:sugar ABC transporter substrate-binding protein [Lachnospiraceae bacterium]